MTMFVIKFTSRMPMKNVCLLPTHTHCIYIWYIHLRHKYHHTMKTLHLTLKMTTAQVVEKLVTNNSLWRLPSPGWSLKTNNWYSWVQTIYRIHTLYTHTCACTHACIHTHTHTHTTYIQKPTHTCIHIKNNTKQQWNMIKSKNKLLQNNFIMTDLLYIDVF